MDFGLIKEISRGIAVTIVLASPLVLLANSYLFWRYYWKGDRALSQGSATRIKVSQSFVSGSLGVYLFATMGPLYFANFPRLDFPWADVLGYGLGSVVGYALAELAISKRCIIAAAASTTLTAAPAVWLAIFAMNYGHG